MEALETGKGNDVIRTSKIKDKQRKKKNNGKSKETNGPYLKLLFFFQCQ